MKKLKSLSFSIFATALLLSCSDEDMSVRIHDPNKTEKVSVDRFSEAAGTLQVRTSTNGLPAPGAAVNFDQGVFITKGLGPNGELVEYYNFDVQPIAPAPIWVLYREGESSPVDGQLNIIDVIPGETDYNDFWQVVKVTVPPDYKANQVASYAEIVAAGYTREVTSTLVNCPVVPEGSTATKRLGGEPNGLIRGWYKEKIVFYFTFNEKSLTTSGANVPLSPIYVSFNINPDDNNPASGPASGFVAEQGSTQTHNVVATLPANAGYSPLWAVNAYDNQDFDSVDNLASAQAATSVGAGPTVNCPVVSIN